MMCKASFLKILFYKNVLFQKSGFSWTLDRLNTEDTNQRNCLKIRSKDAAHEQ